MTRPTRGLAVAVLFAGCGGPGPEPPPVVEGPPPPADAAPEQPFGPPQPFAREQLTRPPAAAGPVIPGAVGKPVAFGPAAVLVRGAAVNRVRYRAGGQLAFSAEPLLMVGVALGVADPKATAEYRTWWPTAGVSAGGATLTDNLGRPLAPAAFPPGAQVVEHAERATLSAGRVAVDLLVFERPDPGVTGLTLELPGANVGAEGVLRVPLPWPLPGAANRLVAKPAAKPAVAAKKPDAESAAKAKLRMARDLMASGKSQKAAEYLRDLTKRYPDTEAAGEANELLRGLAK